MIEVLRPYDRVVPNKSYDYAQNRTQRQPSKKARALQMSLKLQKNRAEAVAVAIDVFKPCIAPNIAISLHDIGIFFLLSLRINTGEKREKQSFHGFP